MNTPNSESAILLVDDDPDVLETLAAQLVCEGFAVTTCLYPEEALEVVRERQFSVVISDQVMPQMTGLELLSEIREIQPNTSRVLITGVFALDTLVGAIRAGGGERRAAQERRAVDPPKGTAR